MDDRLTGLMKYWSSKYPHHSEFLVDEMWMTMGMLNIVSPTEVSEAHCTTDDYSGWIRQITRRTDDEETTVQENTQSLSESN